MNLERKFEPYKLIPHGHLYKVENFDVDNLILDNNIKNKNKKNKSNSHVEINLSKKKEIKENKKKIIKKK